MESDSRRKRSPSEDSDDGHRRRSRKYDRSPSPRRSRYRRSRSRDRRSRSSSRDRRREKSSRSQDWNKVSSATSASSATAANPAGYVPPQVPYQAPPPPNTSQPPPQLGTYASGYSNYNYNYGQGYEYSYQQPPGYRSDYPPPNWPGNQVPYNNQQAPPPPTLSSNQEQSRNVEPVPPGMVPPSLPRPEDAKKEAIAAEVKQQKATLAKQREEYVKKSATLQRELEILRQQCDEIGKEGGCENNRIIKENQKLQVEIQNKMKSINNVIDMLNGIIGDKVTIDDLKNKFKPENRNKRSKSPKEEFSSEKIETPEKVAPSETDRDNKSSKDDKPIYNFVHYDPEMHWCKVCDIFPKTAKEYLNHLHSNNHKETCLERKIVDMPWHEHVGEGSEKEVPYYPGLPTKRTPIKGLQFFSPATAWYCKLCDAWIGDLHCASLHLKSKRHSENFSRFVEQNPHWETDWMADREKAFSDEKHKQIQLEIQKHKEDEQQQPVPVQKPKKAKKNKKKSKKSKKRKQKSSNSDSSSDSENTDSDSDQDTSKSIRVAMRNKMKASTQAILNEEIDYHGIKLKGPWAQVAQQQIQNVVNSELHAPEPDDRQLLNSIRDKLKAKQEEEIKSMNNRKQVMEKTIQESEHEPQFQKKEDEMAAWAQKDPSKPFWLKKEEEKLNVPNKPEIPEPKEIPKPHMGFWTKQQVNMPPKPIENKPIEKEDDRDRDRERDRDRDRYKDDRDRKYDRRDDKYERYDKYDRRRGRDRDRDRDRDYYDDRRKRDRDSGDSPRRNWRESPKRGYDKYKERREDSEPNDDSKFDKKMNDPKLKKNSAPPKKPPTPITKGKLPFIGRLPLFKKKVEEPKLPEKEPLPLPYTQSKFENTPKVPCEIINPPGVVHITKLATPLNLNNSSMKPQMKILVAPPPPVLKESKPTQQVVDMEIEDQSEEVVIEQPIIDHQKETAKIPVPTTLPPMNQPPPNFISQQQDNKPFINRPPPMFNNPPPPVNFTQNPPPRFQLPRPNFIQNHQTQIPPPNIVGYPNPPPAVGEVMVPDVSEIPEPTDKRPENSHPLPEDLQEALNIIFPKDEVPESKGNSQDNSIMYASMYSMLGCVGYGPEFMDHPPPEITQPEQDSDAQPGPDDLRMLGIDEGDCVL